MPLSDIGVTGFQRLVDRVLGGLSDFAMAYLDDIVYSDTWDEHLKHLKVVFECLQVAGLTVNAAKCTFAKVETEYLGHVIGRGVIKPQVQKVPALQSCPLPQTRTQLKSFLGMSGWYHKFIPNYSARAAVLTDMTSPKKPNQLCLTEEGETAYKDVQQALSSETVLYCPDFEQPFILQTDAWCITQPRAWCCATSRPRRVPLASGVCE